jgi:tyrosine-protein kinase Etk/Wzc
VNSYDLGGESIHLRDYLYIIYKRRWLILSCLFFVLTATSYLTFTAKPVYEAQSTIRIEPPRSGNSILSQSTNWSYYKLLGQLETEIEVVKSRSIAEQVVTRLGLPLESLNDGFTKQELFESISVTREAAPGEYRIDFENNGGFEVFLGDSLLVAGELGVPVLLPGFTFTFRPDLEVVPRKLEFEILDFDSAVKSFMKNSEAKPVKDTNIIKISVRGHDPKEVEKMVNTWAGEFLSQGLAYNKLEARSVREFLEEQLSVVSEQLRGSEEALQDFKESAQVVVLGIEAESQITELARFEAERAAAITEMDGIGRFLQKIEEKKESGEDLDFWQVTTFPSLINNQTIWKLKEQLVTLSVRKKELAQVLEETHPDLIVVNSQIALVEEDLKREGSSYISGLESKVEALDQTIHRFQEKLERLPEKEVKLARLERSAKVNEEIYTLLLKRHKEAQISEAMEIGDIRVVDPARGPRYPVKPNKRLNLALGLLAGLLFGLATAFLVEYFDTTLKSWEEVSKKLDLPMLGAIPRIRVPKAEKLPEGAALRSAFEAKLISHTDSRSPVSEAYRTVRTNIQYFDITEKVQTLLFTSPGPKEGKSTTISNLAVTMAQQGVRTLIVDADLRKPVVAKIFGVSRTPGLTDILVGKASLSMCIAETGIDNLYILPSGALPPNPSELLSSQKMDELIELLREAFDTVLLDSPPVLAVTDASVLAKKTDGVVLVVRSGLTEEEAALMARHHLEQVRARVIGVVVNDFDYETNYYRKGYYKYYTAYYRSDDEGKGKRKKRARKLEPAVSRKDKGLIF